MTNVSIGDCRAQSSVTTSKPRIRWDGSRSKNGELLALASESFDVFVTVDRNLSFQQNLGAWPIAVIILQGTTNRLADLMPLVPDLLAAIAAAELRTVQFIGEP